MKRRNPFHQRYHDDWLRGCRVLTIEERGAYNTLVDLMYSDSDTLADNERILAAELGVSIRKYRILRDNLIRKGKLYYYSEGRLSNRRFEQEIERRELRSASAREAGQRGGLKKAENNQTRSRLNQFGSFSTPEFAPNSENSSTKSKAGSSSSEAINRKKEDVSESSGEEIKHSAELIRIESERKKRGIQ